MYINSWVSFKKNTDMVLTAATDCALQLCIKTHTVLVFSSYK